MKLKRIATLLVALMLSWTIAYADTTAIQIYANEPIETMLLSIIQEEYPGCQLFDYAPIGQENAEYIILARDSANKPGVMIVNTEQPIACVEFCNTDIMEGIPLEKSTVQIMDHILDGHPYIEYNNPDGQDYLYVIFCKNANGRWYVTEAQFGDEWNDFYWFRYSDRDQKIHVYLTGNEVMALSDDRTTRRRFRSLM